jgi:hypothetical protein
MKRNLGEIAGLGVGVPMWGGSVRQSPGEAMAELLRNDDLAEVAGQDDTAPEGGGDVCYCALCVEYHGPGAL